MAAPATRQRRSRWRSVPEPRCRPSPVPASSRSRSSRTTPTWSTRPPRWRSSARWARPRAGPGPVGDDRSEHRQQTKQPKNFNATDPAAYKAPRGRPTTTSTGRPQQYGLTVDFVVAGGAPRWAEGAGHPVQLRREQHNTAGFFAWKPNATDYGQFLHAVATRYDGQLHAQGPDRAAAASPLLDDLERAELRRGSRPAGDRRLDGLLRADDVSRPASAPAGSALQRTGHGKDTILIGGFAAIGSDPHAARPAAAPRGCRATPARPTRSSSCAASTA